MKLTNAVARSATGLKTIGEGLASTKIDEVGVVGSRRRLARFSTLLLASFRAVLLNIGRVQSQVATAITAIVAAVVVLTVLPVLTVVLSILAVVLTLALTLTSSSESSKSSESSELSIDNASREEDRENS